MPFSEHQPTNSNENSSYLISDDFPSSLPTGKEPLTQETIKEMIAEKLQPAWLHIQTVEDHGTNVWIFCGLSTGNNTIQNTVQDRFTKFEPKLSGATLIIEVNKNTGAIFVRPTFY